MPVIALVGIFDRVNEPVLMQNYLARHLEREGNHRAANAAKNLDGAEEDIERIKRDIAAEMETIQMQMSMLAFTTLDIFTEKSQIVPDRVKTA